MTFKLSPNILRASACDAYRRARQARRHALRYPHTFEREMRSCEYWKESALFWRREAEMDECAPNPVWIMPTWEAELEYLFGNAPAEVE